MSEEVNSPTERPSDTEFLAEFLVSNLLKPSQKFHVNEERLSEAVSGLPEDIQNQVKGWVPIYLAWLFKVHSVKKRGAEFTNTLFVEVRERLQKEAGHGEGLWPTLEYWFENLDKVTARAGTTVNSWEIPFEVLVALCFLVFDSKSPHYKNPSPDTNMVELDIGFILGSAAQEAREAIELAIDSGCSIDKNAT
jgi:hypothetical protein